MSIHAETEKSSVAANFHMHRLNAGRKCHPLRHWKLAYTRGMKQSIGGGLWILILVFILFASTFDVFVSRVLQVVNCTAEIFSNRLL